MRMMTSDVKSRPGERGRRAASEAEAGLSVVVPLYLWVNRLGLLDTYLGVLAPDLVSVFGVFLMRQAIEVVPSDYIDAGRIDGCGELGIFWRIIVPNLKQVFAVVIILSTIWDFKVFAQVYLMPGGAGSNREALNLGEGDQVVFLVIEGRRAILARTPDLLDLAGSVPVPAGVRGLGWDEVRRRAWAGQLRG